MSVNIPLSELHAARIESTFHRRRALVLEQQNLERDEAILLAMIENEHGLKPGTYQVDHVTRQITIVAPASVTHGR
jgi:hypothetical protein